MIVSVLCSFMMTFLYPSQRPDTHNEIDVVQSNCWELLWSSKTEPLVKLFSAGGWWYFMLHMGMAWKRRQSIINILHIVNILGFSHGKVSMLRLLNILVREREYSRNVAQLKWVLHRGKALVLPSRLVCKPETPHRVLKYIRVYKAVVLVFKTYSLGWGCFPQLSFSMYFPPDNYSICFAWLLTICGENALQNTASLTIQHTTFHLG